MRNMKKFERKCLKLHEEFQNNFSKVSSFNQRFKVLNNYINNFSNLAQKIKPNITCENILEYNKRIDFFINDCQNEMKFYLTRGTDYYKKCSSNKECLKLFRQYILQIAKKFQLPEFYDTILVVPTNSINFKTTTIRHAFNSDKVENINGVLVPFYSLVFDTNLSDILENYLYFRIHNIQIRSKHA